MRKNRHVTVHAEWDPEAAVFVVVGDDVPGLATEACSAMELARKLKIMIPELLALNGNPSGSEVFWLEVRA